METSETTGNVIDHQDHENIQVRRRQLHNARAVVDEGTAIDMTKERDDGAPTSSELQANTALVHPPR